MITQLGSAQATTIIPVLGDACFAINGAVGATLPEISANASAMASVNAGVTVEYGVDIAADLIAAASVAASAGVSVAADVSAGIAGSFNITIDGLKVFLDLAAYLNGLRGSITATSFTGTVGGFSGESGQMVSGAPSDSCFAITLSATTNESIASLKAIFALVD